MATQTVPVSCNKDCGAGCPLVATVSDGTITRITDNPERLPTMRGCARGYMAHRITYSSDRITTPLMRTGPRGGGSFREAGWDEALSFVAENMSRIKGEHGPQSVMRIGGSGSCRGVVHNTGRLAARFLTLYGGFTEFSNSYSVGAEAFVTPYVYGTHHVGIDAPTLLHSQLVILLGANISDTRFGSETESILRQVKKSGVPIITVDPRKTRTAYRLATEWLPIAPGTDTALLAAVLHVLLSDGLIDRDFVATHSVGFDGLERYVLGSEDGIPKNPSWAENICHLSSQRIGELARAYGRSKPAALIPGLSIQRNVGGEEAMRMSMALQVVTGNVGIPGGSSGGNIWGRLPSPRCGTIGPGPATRPRIAAVPVVRWPDAVLEGTGGGYPTDIQGLYVVGGNYLATGSDVRKSIRAFEAVDFSVCHDIFLTPTARYCDVFLPATTFLEREDVVFSAGNYLFYSARGIERIGGSRDDYDIFADLSGMMDFGDEFTEGKSSTEWLDACLDESEIPDREHFKSTGVYIGNDIERIGLAEFIAEPDAHPLNTPSGKIELSSERYASLGFRPCPTYRGFKPNLEYPLSLVSPHARYRVNSQNTNDPWFRGCEDQVLWINPADAESRRLTDGELVEVFNRQGRVSLPVRVTKDIMPGVVCLLAGAWPSLDPEGLDTGRCANLLTTTEPTEPSNGSRTHSIGVEVKKTAQ